MFSLKTLLLDYRSDILKLTALGFGQAVCYVLTAVVIQQIFDRFLIGSSSLEIRHLSVYALVLSIVAIANGLIFMRERVCAERMGQNIVHDIRVKIFKHLTRVYPNELEKKKKGGLNLRLVNDLTAIRQWATLGISRILVSGISILLTISALAYTSFILGSLVLLFIILGVIFSIFLGPKLKSRVSEARKRRARLANNAGEKINAMKTVQVFGQERYEIKKIKRQSKALIGAMLERAEMIGLLRGSIITLTGLATMGIIVTGTYLVKSGQTTPGTVTAAITIIGFLIPPLRDFGRTYEYWISFRVAVGHILQTLSLKRIRLKSNHHSSTETLKGDIEFRNIEVSGVFSNFNAKAKAKDKIIITGLNGTGKSTLFSLLLGIVKPDKGEILIDGKPLKNWDIRFLRSHIGVVSSDLPLLRGSLRKNISYGQKNVSNDILQEALNLSGLSEKRLQVFPEGLDTLIVERGENLSAGERQIFALTRALLGKPEILLLDEADSNLDTVSKEVIASLLKMYPGTVLSITHNSALIGMANHTWEITSQYRNEKSKHTNMHKKEG